MFSIPVGVVYRPNPAKVKNLKAKDYLGKARLIAGHEHRNHSLDTRQQILTSNLSLDSSRGSYGALNLVRPGLSSRSGRQQSEPPINRSMFPPTPPPEAESPVSRTSKRKSIESARSSPAGLSRARSGAVKPQRLELGVAAFERSRQDGTKGKGIEKPRLATVRSESERPRQRRELHMSGDGDAGTSDADQRRNFREEEVRLSVKLDNLKLEQPSTERLLPTVYQGENAQLHSVPQSRRHLSIDEEKEDTEDEVSSRTSSSAHTLSPGVIRPADKSKKHARHHRTGSRRPEMRKIRVKVHADDTRYVTISPRIPFAEFVDQVRNKFGFANDFKLKMRDEEGDMVTMGDQDDLDMCVEACRKVAGSERAEVGRMDVGPPFYSLVA